MCQELGRIKRQNLKKKSCTTNIRIILSKWRKKNDQNQVKAQGIVDNFKYKLRLTFNKDYKSNLVTTKEMVHLKKHKEDA